MKNFSYILFSICLLACAKQEIVVVDGNAAPEEKLVTNAMKRNYINKLYITILGRKASEAEFDTDMTLLGDQASQEARENLVNQLVGKEEAAFQLYEVARNDFLNGIDTTSIQREHLFYQAQLTLATGAYREYLLYEIERLGALRQTPHQLEDKTISPIEMHKRVVNNFFYDEINMGTENFVVATFQNFLYRYPTTVELEEASKMVEGVAGYLFFTNGSGKKDFLDIFFSSTGYLEGQVIDLHKKYLFRDPSTQEMVDLTLAYSNGASYTDLQVKLLASDAYFFN